MTGRGGRGVRYWVVRPSAIPARIFLLLGAVALSIAFWAYCAQRTILDPEATRDLATALVDTDRVAGTLVDELAAQLVDRAPEAAPDGTSDAVTESQAAAIARAAIADPRVAAAFGSTLGDLHEQLLLGNEQGDVALDTAAINAALSDSIAAVDPALADRIGNADPVELSIDAGSLPSLRAVDERSNNVLLAAALLGLIAFGLGVVVHPDPWQGVTMVGRRLVAISLVPVVFYVVVPAALRAIGAGWGETLAPFADAYGSRILPAAITLLVGGIALWIGGHVARVTQADPAPRSRHGDGPGPGLQRLPRSTRRTSRRATPYVSPAPGRTDLRL